MDIVQDGAHLGAMPRGHVLAIVDLGLLDMARRVLVRALRTLDEALALLVLTAGPLRGDRQELPAGWACACLVKQGIGPSYSLNRRFCGNR